MPRFAVHRRAAAGGAALALALAGSATAAVKITATPVTRSHKSALLLGHAIVRSETSLKDAIFQTAPPNNHPNLLVRAPHEAIDGFPRDHGMFAVLTDGCGLRFDQTKYKGSYGCNDSGLRIRGTRDLTILRLTVNVPKGDTCLSFRFRFLSNEFPTWVGSQYNDGFIAEIDHDTWTSQRSSPYIHAPRDFAKTPTGQPITINATGVGKVNKANAKGTGYNAATRILRASTPVKPGNHFVYFSIFDQGDRNYDSAVFLDDLTTTHRASCHAGVAYDQS